MTKTTYFCYIVSMALGSGHSSAQLLFHGCSFAAVKVFARFQSHGTAVLQTLVVWEEFTSVGVVEMKAWVPSWRLVSCHPQVIGFSKMQLLPSKHVSQEHKSQVARQKSQLFCRLSTEVTALVVCHLILIRSKSLDSSHSRERSQDTDNQGIGIRGQLRVCLAQQFYTCYFNDLV